jgi:hypothetical protein
MNRGVLYIAFGRKFVEEALFSARSVKRHSPGLRIALFTDAGIDDPAVDIVKKIDPGHIRAKVDYISESPFERTLYLDSDTKAVRSVDDALTVLDRFDVAMTHELARSRAQYEESIPEYGEIPYAFPELNGGLLAYRRTTAALDFLRDWRDLFHRYREVTSGWDQPTLRIALWRSNVRLHTLPPEYNVRNYYLRRRISKAVASGNAPDVLAPRILHWHGLNHPVRWWTRFSLKHRPQRL